MNINDINRPTKKFQELKSQIWQRKVKSQSQSIDFDQQ